LYNSPGTTGGAGLGDGTSVFRDLDPDLWDECEHNPRQLLERSGEYRLFQMATDPFYIERLRSLNDRFEQYMAKPLARQTESSKNGGSVISPEHPVAYF